MIRHQYSYWLVVNTNHADFKHIFASFEQYLRSKSCLYPEGPLCLSINVKRKTITGSVHPDFGTIEEDSELSKWIACAAAKFPSLDIVWKACDEEDKSVECFVYYENGKVQRTQHSRMVPCDKKYDSVTTAAITEYLRATGFIYIADMVTNMFYGK